jgi:DNA polymerase-1
MAKVNVEVDEETTQSLKTFILGDNREEAKKKVIKKLEERYEEMPKYNIEEIKNKVLGMDRYLVQTGKDFKEMLEDLKNSEVFAYDLETTGLNVFHDQIVGASFAIDGKGWYVPVNHKTEQNQIPLFKLLDDIEPIMLKEDNTKIAQNFKFDYKFLKYRGVDIKGQWLDTMVAGWLHNENNSNKLKQMTKRYLDYEQVKIKSLVNFKKGETFADIEDLAVAGHYAVDDAITTFRLMQYFAPRLEKRKLTKPFLKVEMPFVRVLAEMELEGVDIDKKYLEEVGEILKEEMEEIQAYANEKNGEPINLNSPKQKRELLYGKLGYPVYGKTATGKPSTNRATLTKLAKDGHDLATKLSRYNKLSKRYSTFVVGIVEKLEDTGKVHGSFNHTGTHTGRISSSSPNLQQIPSRGDETKIKKAFYAPEGYKLINADYSQVELRIMAHFSQDKQMIKAYKEGEDFHCRTASNLSDDFTYEEIKAIKDKDDNEEELTENEKWILNHRQLAKSINFGLIYGMGAKGLSEGQKGMSKQEAQRYIDRYFNKFRGIDKFVNDTHSLLKRQGYLRTLTGRMRRIPKIWSDDFYKVASAERQSINNKIQGSAGDIMKLAMNDLFYEVFDKYNARMLIQVHDEILVKVPEENADKCLEEMKEVMENVVDLRVPLLVDIHTCDNWYEGH